MYQLTMLSVLLRSHSISFSEIFRDIFSNDRPSTLPSFRKEILKTDLLKQVGTQFEVPIYFVSGQHDWQVHYEETVNYFNQISAPQKEILLLENSAHLVVIEEPGRFLNFMVNRVLPLAENLNQQTLRK